MPSLTRCLSTGRVAVTRLHTTATRNCLATDLWVGLYRMSPSPHTSSPFDARAPCVVSRCPAPDEPTTLPAIERGVDRGEQGQEPRARAARHGWLDPPCVCLCRFAPSLTRVPTGSGRLRALASWNRETRALPPPPGCQERRLDHHRGGRYRRAPYSISTRPPSWPPSRLWPSRTPSPVSPPQEDRKGRRRRRHCRLCHRPEGWRRP
mmetsp:Transcript_63151/g.173455  ORF Transcript_63151/g.173455 Transcript_63151/m.173455 type:complete len:207 (+) Transcript_63151:73-693(+)